MLATDLQAELERRELAWLRALEEQNAAALGTLLHDNFTSTPPRSQGEIIKKSEYIACMAEVQVCDYELRDAIVCQSENVAILKARLICHSKFGGTDLNDDLLITDVWIRSAQGWLALARHASQISKSPISG